MKPHWQGIAAALASAVLFGASTPFAKLLLGSVSPWMLAGLLYLGAGLGLAAMLAAERLSGAPRAEAGLTARDLPWLIGVIAAGGVAGPVLLMFGLAQADAASASLLLTLEGLATMAIAWVVFGESAARRIVAGAMLIVAGAVALAWPRDGVAVNFGAVLVAGAGIAWAVDNNLTRKISASDPVEIATVKGIAAGAVNLALALAQGAAFPPAGTVAGALAVGFLGYGASLALFILALRHLGAARTAAYFGTAPFIGAVIAVAMLGEPVSGALIAGGVLIGAGVWIHLAERHQHLHVHEPMAHEHRHVHDEHHRHSHRPEEPAAEPHSHWHAHARLVHRHPHYPDLHHRHGHSHG
jgi:drug/metabolite transporter (DMT)-like permease